MKIRNFLHDHSKQLVTLVVYLILTLIFALFYFRYDGKLYAGDDLLFHYSRLEEILQTKITKFPVVATHYFGMTGNQVNVFYPVQLLYPLVILIKLFSHPVGMIYFYFGCFNFFTLVVIHYAVSRLGKSWRMCVSFAVLYTLSFYRLFNFFKRADWGEFFAMTFLPLVFIGLTLIGRQRGGRTLLTIGMVGLLFSHVLTAVITSIISFCWVVCVLIHSRKRWSIIRSLEQSALAILGIGFIFWFPFMTHYLKVPSGFRATLAAYSVLHPFKWSRQARGLLQNSMFSSPTNLDTVATVGFLMFLLLFLIIIFFIKYRQQINCSSWLILGGTLISFWLTTPLFPWSWLKNTPINIIQFPFRINIFVCLGIAWCAAQLVEIFPRIKWRNVWLSSMVVFTCLFSYQAVDQLMQHPRAGLPYLSEKNFYNYRSNMPATNDYFPKQALSDINLIPYHVVVLNGKNLIIHGQPSLNQITYQVDSDKKKNVIDLPFLCYSDNYQVTNWGQPVAYRFSKRGTFEIQTHQKTNQIQIQYQPTFSDRYSGLVSFISLISFICILLINRYFHRYLI